eukprot:6197676-Pleurochrysis_carterae.AAC.2
MRWRSLRKRYTPASRNLFDCPALLTLPTRAPRPCGRAASDGSVRAAQSNSIEHRRLCACIHG